MPTNFPPPPDRSPLLERVRFVSGAWLRWFQDLVTHLQQAANNVASALLDTQAASIGTTVLLTSVAGLYRLTYYARITTAAGVSSSLTVAIGWTHLGVVCSHTFTAITGNTTATTGSESYMVHADGGTSITYTVTYASNPAAAMVYALDLVVEALA